MLKNIFVLFLFVSVLEAETLFEVKDASDNPVLNVSTDGLRIMNEGDTLMVISSDEIKANIGTSSKGLSRSFSVTTTASKGSGSDLMRLTSDSTRFWISDTGSGFGVSSQSTAKNKSVSTNFLKVSNVNTQMREGISGDSYTDFSPENLFLGLNAGRETYTGINNIFIGNECGTLNYYGNDNIYIGYQAGYRNDYASENIFIGNYSGYNNDTDDDFPYGSMNVFLGTYSGYNNIDGYVNTFLGYRAGEDNGGAKENTYVGGYAGSNNNGDQNSALGVSALGGNTTGIRNTAIGTYAGTNNLTGSRNVFLGYSAGYNETSSDKLYIENTNSSTPLIWGDFANDLLRFYGNVGINAANSAYGLYVVDDYMAVYGNADNTSGTYIYGLYGDADGGTLRNVSVYGSSASGTGENWAGYFNGDVNVTGTVTKGADAVKIDYPLDPENKILSHSGVISDEMATVYNGNIVLDGSGNATVKLPGWFETFNRDYKYQLTAIGAPGPNLYISKELSDNSFGIAGGTSGMKVSWQLTAVRNDNYAKANPVTVVDEKSAENKGLYIHPAAFGLDDEKGIEYQIQKREALLNK